MVVWGFVFQRFRCLISELCSPASVVFSVIPLNPLIDNGNNEFGFPKIKEGRRLGVVILERHRVDLNLEFLFHYLLGLLFHFIFFSNAFCPLVEAPQIPANLPLQYGLWGAFSWA